jgi:hypothetical protein
MIALSPDSVLGRSDRLAWSALDGEAVVLAPESRTLHRLNGTGTRCWELLDGSRTLAEVGACLAAEYEIPAGEAVAELQVLAAMLVDAALVEVVA